MSLAHLAAIVPDAQAADDAQPHHLWPEHAPAFELFCVDLRTQWRVGMGGRTGLDYTACVAALRLRHTRQRTAELLDDLRVLEHAYLDEEAQQRAREDAARGPAR